MMAPNFGKLEGKLKAGAPDGAIALRHSRRPPVVRDADNAPMTQNFKLLSWADVRRALKLP